MITERDLLLAWVAGIMDGEGCLTISPGTNNGRSGATPQLMLSMTDQETVERVCRIIGLGQVSKAEPKNPRHKTKYNWNLCSQNAIAAIKMFRPYLFLKDQQADILIRFNEEAQCGRGQRLTLDQIHLRKFLLDEIRKLNQ